MIGGVWNDWLTWWNSPEFKKISNKNKRNRESSNGEACVHTGGSLSLINLLDRIKKIHGEHVDEMDALIAMHTRKGPSGELIWASKKHEKVFRQYKDIVRERAIAAGIIDPNDASNTRVPFEGKDWDDAIMAASEGQRTGRGNIIFGFGRGGRALLNLPTRGTHTSSICQVPGNCSSRSIRELQLETEVDGLKVMMKEMIEKQEKEQQNRELEKERDRQERERERQEQNQWLMQLLMNHQQQRVPWGSQHPQPNQWPPGLMMTGASGSFQHQLQNQWSLGMLSPLPPQQLQQQQMQLLPQPQSGQSSASPNNNGRGGCGSEEGGGSRNGSGGRSRNGSGGGNGCRSDTFAVGVENGSLLEMLTDPNYGRAGSGRGV